MRRGARSKLLAVFRLYPEPRSSRYALVHVWRTKRDMHAFVGLWTTCTRDTLGFCSGVNWYKRTPGGRLRRAPVFADVHFFRARLGMEIVTHELFHATIAWGRRVCFDFSQLDQPDSVNRHEETLTHVHGRLCSQFVDRAYRAKLYGPNGEPVR